MEFIHQVEPYISENTIKGVNEYLSSGGWLTEFKQTREFEQAVAKFVNAKHGTAVTSGTAALYLSLRALNIGPGDAVVVPNYTMIATINAVVWAGAEPIIADISPDTLCLDLNTVKLNRRCKALIYVSINGRHGNMKELMYYCRDNKLYLLEDAAQSLGSKSEGSYLGTFGTAGIYSFTPHKIITTGQGGMIVTNDDSFDSKVKKLKDFCRREPASDWHDEIGYNFKFTDLQAVVGIQQMKEIDFRIDKKKKIFQRYHENLKSVSGVEFLPTALNDIPPWFVDVIVRGEETRDKLVSLLKNKNIGSRPFYPPLNHQKPYQRFSTCSFPVSEQYAYRGLWLPSSIGLTDEKIDFVCHNLKNILEEIG